MNCSLPSRLRVALLGATVFVSSASAQVRLMRVSAPAARSGVRFRPGARPGFAHVRARRFFPGSAFLPFPYYYPGYDYQPVEAEAPPPQAVVVQSAAPPAPPVTPAEPLVLEYQGGEWVRIGNYSQSPAGAPSVQPGPAPTSSLRSVTPGGNEAAQPPRELPPAVLVFRNGHKEEVERYTIMGTVIYASADYWSTGSWTRKVPIAELDVPATRKLNQERGGKFSLPSAPNELVIRP